MLQYPVCAWNQENTPEISGMIGESSLLVYSILVYLFFILAESTWLQQGWMTDYFFS